MHKRSLCRHAVSVCLSVTFVDCVKTNKNIFEFFTPSSSHTILVFPYQTRWRYSDGNGDVECRWGRQKSRYWAYVCCWRCNKRGVVNMVAGGRRPPSCKLWHLYRWSYTAGIRPPSATRDKVTPSAWFFSARTTKRALALYTTTIDRMYDSKALRYAEDNRTKSNCIH